MNYNREEILNDIINGKPLIITDDEDRENEGDFFVAASRATDKSILLMLNEGRGLVCTPMSKAVADKFNLSPMVNDNSSSHTTAFTVSVDHIDNTTGISLLDRLTTIKKLADKKSKSSDFLKPGHIFPLIAVEGGLKKRRGHTEASVDLCKLAGLEEVGVICEILNDDGSIAQKKDLKALSVKYDLKIVSIDEIIKIFNLDFIETKLPTKYGEFKMYHFDEGESSFSVLGIDANSSKTPIVRVHSECFTGDVFGSMRCDCGEQLSLSLKKISDYGHGYLIYLKQEGRGIGLNNKLNAYNLQDEGFDTFEANLKLGFKDDMRDYHQALLFLKKFNINKLKLISNNPEKINFLLENNIEIEERIDLGIFPNQKNRKYFIAKKNKKNHFLNTEVRNEKSL